MKDRGLDMKKGNEHLILAYAMNEITNGKLTDQSSFHRDGIAHGSLTIVDDEGHQAVNFLGQD